MLRFLKIAIAAAVLAVPMPGAEPAFEVASIKPNVSGARNSGYRRAGPGELNATNVTLKMLITMAYDVQGFQVTGGPGWIENDRFDVLAKPAPGSDPSREMLRRRVQSLLADRFQLVLHRTSRELPRFVLTIGKNGPKLHEATSSTSDMFDNGHQITAHRTTMATFAKIALQGELGRAVSDQTGLTGEYDFTLDWAPTSETGETSADGPSFFTALQEQLGLKLESDKGPVEILVVDRAQRPSEN